MKKTYIIPKLTRSKEVMLETLIADSPNGTMEFTETPGDENAEILSKDRLFDFGLGEEE